MIIKPFSIFKSKNNIESICREFGINNYSINEDGSIDADCVFINSRGLKKLPLKFRNIEGSFQCQHNHLTSLEGCPETVGGNFACNNNHLFYLKYSPKKVGGFFNCQENELMSLEGCPQSITGGFHFERNNISSFEGFPETVDFFFCHMNPVSEIYELNPCKDFIEMINEYKVIRGNKIVETRLRQALEDSGLENVPEEFKFKNYKLV